jgi:phosphate butyryltransferase
MITSFDQMLEEVKSRPRRSVAIAVAHDRIVMEAAAEASRRDIAEPVLVGDAKRIEQIAKDSQISLNNIHIVDESNDLLAVRVAVEMTSSGKTDMVMKGYIHTDDFLRGVLDKEIGLRTGYLMSHVSILEVGHFNRLIFVTDGAMNIQPTLEEKAQIILNAVQLAEIFGIDQPKVAVLAAIELVNPKMPNTLDAAALGKMGDRGQFSAGIVDGPFALDDAVSMLAAQHKRIRGTVAGAADILLVPNVEAGNILGKAFVYFSQGRIAGVLMGAAAPVVLTSRADTAEAKLLSIATGVFIADVQGRLGIKIGKVHY